MERYINGLLIGLVIASCCFFSCSKEFLEAKPQKSQVIVKTVEDVAALLDNSAVMNRVSFFRLIADGDLLFTGSKLTSSAELHRNLYFWKTDYDPTNINTTIWDVPYQQILYANIALETLNELNSTTGNESVRNELRGRALFFRAWAHYQLLQDFAPGFDPNDPAQLGIPIIKESKFPKNVHRAKLTEVYDFIVEDLEGAEELLPTSSQLKTRPTKQAVYCLLSRLYLNKIDYERSLFYTNRALEISSTLIDYNKLSPTAVLPFSPYDYSSNPEIVFFASPTIQFVSADGVEVDHELYDSYDVKDLRRTMFYNENRQFVGTYSGRSDYQFAGLAIDELYLSKAECLVRMYRLEEAQEFIVALLEYRFVNNVVTSDVPQDVADLLRWILLERRKELFGRGTRWTDLKRLNREPELAVNLTRNYQDQVYELQANSNRYVFYIPESEIEISNLEQNVR